eukprot:TRINITY_DN13842_c0_g2_i1.p1 TRINITY_DN13842_c0_g2~~TRINITY_DN13842_c0_g2_i1.p1  ORF type:complete len:444 (-),score=41.13 TRINITY_DN13842_c0_g2_i1:56-1387(-)
MTAGFWVVLWGQLGVMAQLMRRADRMVEIGTKPYHPRSDVAVTVAHAGQFVRRKPRMCSTCAYHNLNAMAASANGMQMLPAKPSRFLMVSYGDSNFYAKGGAYHTNALALGCYGNRWGVPARAVDPKQVRKCNKYDRIQEPKMWFFRRVCAMKTLFGSFEQIDKAGKSRGAWDLGLAGTPEWVVHLDGDSILFNGDLGLHTVVRPWSGKDLVFYERFRNGEVVAGNYAARVSTASKQFLQQWESFSDEADFYFSNWDNGALHLQLVRFLQRELRVSNRTLNGLRNLWRKSSEVSEYDRFVAGAKLAIGRRRNFSNVLILRRAHGFCIDDDVHDGATHVIEFGGGPAARYLCVHGLKHTPGDIRNVVGHTCVQSVEHCYSSLLTCQKPWVDPSLLMPVILHVPLSRKGLGEVNDVGECWPSCPTDLSRATWKQLRRGLRKSLLL